MVCRAIPIVAMLAVTLAPVVAQPNAAPASHCAGAEYREFDFWVGSWDVYPTGGSQLVAHSLIESVYNGWVRGARKLDAAQDGKQRRQPQ
jgi:hypothetical protein